MLYKLLTLYDRKKPLDQASASCGIPCKVYDPSAVQLAVLSMLRMVDLLNELKKRQPLNDEQIIFFKRYMNEKKSQSQKIKQEIGAIWGHYIMESHVNLQPELHHLTHKIMLSLSFATQKIDRTAMLNLLDLVNQFSECFWKSHNTPTYRAVCPYPPAQTIVYPDLKT